MTAGKKIWNVAWRIVVCALLLGWIFHAIFTNEAKLAIGKTAQKWEALSKMEQWQAAWKLGPPELWHTLASVDPLAFALSVIVVGSILVLGVIRWRMVLEVQGLHLPFVRALEISMVAQCFNSFLLGSSGGDLMKAYYAARETHHKKTEAVTTVFVDRLIGLWTMLFFAVLMMIPGWKFLLGHEALTATSVLVLGMLGACTVLLTIAFWGGVSKRFPTARTYLRRLPKGEVLERSLESCRQFGSRPGFLLNASLVSFALNVLCVVQGIIVAKGLKLEISPMVLFVVVPIIICISALPITPSGLGVRENLFVLMLAAPGIKVLETSALSLSLLLYAGSLCWSIFGGIVYLCLKEKEHLQEIAQAGPGEENS